MLPDAVFLTLMILISCVAAYWCLLITGACCLSSPPKYREGDITLV